ncbi:unnamed protein product [Acanthoscelides obtectus]|uniref:Uncharacterized protein n=1 Tax=Acanthoscelides obtectus TaxID=200917 RepID=A0A9P0LPI4_ACAOB|nr:unnamed protein product [Acanthoscelides obtectus]CAK1651292.1 hypothetical protein AOBTE_LOCUS17158 [Acanthoscelides obtectus]
MTSKKCLHFFLVTCALSSQVECQQAEAEDYSDVAELRGLIDFDQVAKSLKNRVDKGLDSAAKVINGVLDEISKSFDQAITTTFPLLSNKVIDFGKTLVGLKKQIGGQNVEINVCLIDEASKRIDNLPDDLANLLVQCKSHVAASLKNYTDDIKTQLTRISNETYVLVKQGIKCGKNYKFGCITNVALEISKAIIRVPGEIAYQISDITQLATSFMKQAYSCVKVSVAKTIKMGKKLVKQVEECSKEHALPTATIS